MQQRFNWRSTKQKWAIGLGIIGFLGVLVVVYFLIERLIYIGYGVEWTGFGESRIQKEAQTEDLRRAKTLWDWLQLLIVPAVLAIGGILFNWQQNRRARRGESQRAQDTALQAYLNQISELLIDKGIRDECRRYGDTRVTARARTLSVLSQLDGDRKQIVLRFLREARLINREKLILEGRTIYARYVGLRGADLTNANLRNIKLVDAALEGAILENADLRYADLTNADLRGANLKGANLDKAILTGANFTAFVPTGGDPAPLHTDLRAKGLTQGQFERALVDATTKLPKRFRQNN